MGSRNQEPEHKVDVETIFSRFKSYKDLDYVACWFMKGAYYINNTFAKVAFVSTNSITQGEQVAMLWEPIFSETKARINFAYQSFYGQIMQSIMRVLLVR